MAGVTVVGAGRIGLPVVRNLVAAGHDVEVVDVDGRCRAPVLAAGAVFAGAQLGPVPADRVLLTLLPGNAELRSVIIDQDGLARVQPGALWVDLTSAAPDVDELMQAAALDAGVRWCDAGIGGGPVEARDGTLTLYVGGEADDVAAVRPVLDAVADRVLHVGGAGTGHLAKLLINQLWFTQATAVTEVLLLGARRGLNASALASLLAGSPADSAFVSDYLPRLLDGDRVPNFELSRIVEELDSLSRAARAARTAWGTSEQVAQVHRDALEHLGDVTSELAVVSWLEQVSGQPLS